MNHLYGFSTGRLVVSLSLVIISACTSGKQSNQSPAPASPQPAASSNEAGAGGAASTSFQKWKTAQVLDAFKAAGLEVESPRPMSKPKDYGAAPTTDTGAIQFTIPSLEEAVGHIYSFASEDGLEKMVEYYGNASADNFSWVYVKDNILVQLDGRLAEEKARQYEAALGNVK